MDSPQPRASVRRVRDALRALGLEAQVRELPASTRTAEEAARAVGVEVAQIVKSLVFRAGDEAVLVCMSGANRVDEARLARLLGGPVERASPDFVRERTGFAIGGVPPLAHAHPARVWIDADLLEHELLVAAAGSPHAVFETTPLDLVAMTGGAVADLKRESDG